MLSDDIKNALLNTRINHYLSQKELDVLLTHADVQIFSDGDFIIQQGQKSKGIYILIEGSIIICSKILGQGDVCLAQLHCGNYFGETSIIAKQPSVTSFIADGLVKCVFIKEIYFNNLNLFFPKIKYQMLQAIADDLNERYQLLHANIIKILEKENIKKQSFLIEWTRSIVNPIELSSEHCSLKLEQIKQSEIFYPFTNKEFHELFKNWICLDIPKNCTIIHEAEKNLGCYFILNGAVQANIIHDNKLAKISVLGPLKFFNPLSVINPSLPSLINYTSCEKVILMHLSHQNLNLLQEKSLSVWYKFFDLICASLASFERATNELELRLRTEFYNR